MSGMVEQAGSDELRARAIAWHVRLQSDRATADDWAALTAWLDESEAHLAAFEAVETLAAELDAKADSIRAALAPPVLAPPVLAPPVLAPPVLGRARPDTRRIRWPAWTALAAACVAGLMIAPWAWNGWLGSPVTYRTAIGETRAITLADGSHIHLDGGSTLSVRLGWGQRRVALGEAQASFDVAKDPRRPFVIDAGDERIRVVGTEFNIRHYDASLVLSVRRGVVEVRSPGSGNAMVARLRKGDELRHQDGQAQATLTSVDPDAAFAWSTGRLICSDRPLGEIVSDLNHRYALPIQVSGPAAQRRFTGVLILGDQDALVRHLAGYMALSQERRPDAIILR
ncbi:MAG: FecR domain-containing protein [Caulobacteraceae bacterium]|nr:FecR domain-containing protein [Caulobacteraceae bacterium]